MTTLEKYNAIFCNVLQLNEADLSNAVFKQTPLWNSIGHMSLLSALEDEFDILLEPMDMMALQSYQQGKVILSKYGIIIA
ncbi:MAG: acyl carrier protein [Paludibacteraceae bacterium]|nr:acyl carrier protein [Paludibacteraceae bacterium]